MTSFADSAYWEDLWARTLREHGDKVAGRAPNPHLVREAADLPAGRALDAGCGHGIDALWLAARGWQVTAVDFADCALAKGRALADGAGLRERVTWIRGDLATWSPPEGAFDLVFSLYVHIGGPVTTAVERLAEGVAPRGTLLLVGHRPVDPATGKPTAAASQVQVSVEEAVAALDPERWSIDVAEERPRAIAGSGVDAVIRARRRT